MRPWLQHLNEIEAPICRAWSQALRHDKVQRLFAVVSRLGDGVFWYSLIAVMSLVDGRDGLYVGLHMLLTGGVVLAIYKMLKGTTLRERPYHWATGITAAVPPLDRYSFPSGHPLHAVSFTVGGAALLPPAGLGPGAFHPFGRKLPGSPRSALSKRCPGGRGHRVCVGLCGNPALALISKRKARSAQGPAAGWAT